MDRQKMVSPDGAEVLLGTGDTTKDSHHVDSQIHVPTIRNNVYHVNCWESTDCDELLSTSGRWISVRSSMTFPNSSLRTNKSIWTRQLSNISISL